jgi:hypothetical protein
MGTPTTVQPWARPPGLLLGVAFIGAAFATLFYTFITNYMNKPVWPADEMAIASAVVAAQHAAAATAPR